MNNLANQNKPTTEMEMVYEAAKMSLQAVNTMTALFQSSMDKVTSLNGKVDELLNSTQLQDHERFQIQYAITERVNEIIATKKWSKNVRRYLFPDFYKALKREFSVPKYGNIKRIDYEKAIALIAGHILTDDSIGKVNECIEGDANGKTTTGNLQ